MIGKKLTSIVLFFESDLFIESDIPCFIFWNV